MCNSGFNSLLVRLGRIVIITIYCYYSFITRVGRMPFFLRRAILELTPVLIGCLFMNFLGIIVVVIITIIIININIVNNIIIIIYIVVFVIGKVYELVSPSIKLTLEQFFIVWVIVRYHHYYHYYHYYYHFD